MALQHTPVEINKLLHVLSNGSDRLPWLMSAFERTLKLHLVSYRIEAAARSFIVFVKRRNLMVSRAKASLSAKRHSIGTDVFAGLTILTYTPTPTGR